MSSCSVKMEVPNSMMQWPRITTLTPKERSRIERKNQMKANHNSRGQPSYSSKSDNQNHGGMMWDPEFLGSSVPLASFANCILHSLSWTGSTHCLWLSLAHILCSWNLQIPQDAHYIFGFTLTASHVPSQKLLQAPELELHKRNLVSYAFLWNLGGSLHASTAFCILSAWQTNMTGWFQGTASSGCGWNPLGHDCNLLVPDQLRTVK
jgi:hypothetical protein